MAATKFNTNQSFWSNVGSTISNTVQAAAVGAATSARVAVAIADNLEVVVTTINVLGVTTEASLGKLVHEVTGKPITREILNDREQLSNLMWEAINSEEKEEQKDNSSKEE